MALDPDIFVRLALNFIQEEYDSEPPVVINRTVTTEVLEDGSTRDTVTEETGTLEINRDKMRPMLRGIGRAIVELLQGHAEVPIQNVASGGLTRTGRIE